MSETLNYIQILQQPKYISKAEVQLFHNWVDEYPFAPIYRVLLAAKYQSLDHPDTAKYIEQAAFYVQDRKQLKALLRQWSDLQVEDTLVQEEPITNNQVEETVVQNIIAPTENSETDNIETEEAITSEEKTETIVEAPPIIEEEIIEEEDIIVSDAEETIVEQASEEIEEIVLEEDPIILDSEEDDFISEEDDVEFLKSIGKFDEAIIQVEEISDWILETPGNTIPTISENETIDAGLASSDISYLMPWVNEFEFNYVRKTLPEIVPEEIKTPIVVKKETPKAERPVVLKTKVEASVIKETPKTKKETVIEEQPITDTNTSTTKNHSFDEWLSILEQKKNSKEDAPVFDLPTPVVFTEKELAQEKSNPIIPDNSNIKEKDLKEESAEVKHLAAESISYKNDMGTETLAKLYTLQGKTDLAISIYQKLMVKFPEKNSYFASQIKKLKK